MDTPRIITRIAVFDYTRIDYGVRYSTACKSFAIVNDTSQDTSIRYASTFTTITTPRSIHTAVYDGAIFNRTASYPGTTSTCP